MPTARKKISLSVNLTYEDRQTQEKILRGLGQIVIDSGHFKNLVSGQTISEIIYTAEEYLTLLNTYSPYLKLSPETKDKLFEGLRSKIENEYNGNLQLSYISAFHIAQKIGQHNNVAVRHSIN